MFKAYLSFVLAKGTAMSIVATVLNVDFYRALILVLVSAVTTGIFGAVIAIIQSKESHRVHERLDQLEITSQDIKGAVEIEPRNSDLRERASDHPPQN